VLIEAKLFDCLLETKNLMPDNNALLFMNKYVTYQELVEKIEIVSAGFQTLGIKKGDIVTMAMPNIFEAIYAFYAVNRLGAICHMVHPMTPVKQMERFMGKIGSQTLVIVDTFYLHYQDMLLNQDMTMILVNPTQSFSVVKRFGYKLINWKRLNKIRYSHQVLPFSKLMRSRDIPKSPDVDPKLSAVYLHSGGTSGEPKTIELSNFAVNSLASKTSYILGENQFKNRHMLAVLPLFHGFGLCMGVHAMLCFGGVDTLMPKFDAMEAIKLLQKNQINYIIGVPSLFENLIGKPEIRGAHLKNLHQAYVGGDYVAQDLKNRFDRLMKEFGSKSRLLEGYGLTEVVTVCAVNVLKDSKPGTVGRALPGLDIQIVDLESRTVLQSGQLGEIVVSGDTMMNGYLENTDASISPFLTDDSGKKWVLTGDYGLIDQEGYVHFKQRLKRIVKVSGMPVLPSEIENLLMNFDEITEASAIGVPDLEKGNMIKLFLVAKPNISTEHLNEMIKKTIKAELSVYALPKEIVYLESLPKTIIGKIDTRKLESM